MNELQPTHWPRVLVLWLCGVLAALQFAKIAVAFSALQAHYGSTSAQMGWVLSATGVVGLTMGVGMGVLASHWGYRRLLLGGLLLGASVNLLQFHLPSLGWMIATRVLEGASHLSVVVAAPTLMAASAAPRHRAIAMGLWSTFMGVGFAAAGAWGPAFMHHYGLPTVFVAHAGGLVFAALAVFWVCPADRSRNAATWSLAALCRQHVQVYSAWTTALPGLCFLGYTGMAVALFTFLPRTAGADQAWLATALPLAGMVGTFGAGWIAQHHLTPLRLTRYAFLALLACAIVWGGVQWAGWRSAFAALALMVCAGLAGGSAFVLIPALNATHDQQSRANGALAQMGNLGSTLGPPAFAWALAQAGTAGIVAGLVACAGLGLLWTLWGTAMQRRFA